MSRGPLVVSFHTPDPLYTQHARKLVESCRAAGVDSVVVEIESRGNWVENCAMKGPFVLTCMQTHARPLLWIDADGRLRRFPGLLENPAEDFAVFARPGRRDGTVHVVGRGTIKLPDNWPTDISSRFFNSGTIYFSNRQPAVELLRRWAELCCEKPRDWDQWHLQQAWADTQPETLWLPLSYCAIRGRCRGEPVISHEMASTGRKGVDRG